MGDVMSDKCEWIHEQLEQLPLLRYLFNLENLPRNGIYFFYEDGEVSPHKPNQLRIVRIGTHKENNFRSRIAEHFLLNENKMNFDLSKSPPHDRSIFRKNIGRALLNRDNDKYLDVWEKKLMSRENREKYRHLRNITKEKEVEGAVTDILRQKFMFRFLVIDDESLRMGQDGLEGKLIATVAQCGLCKPSPSWFGHSSPVAKIRDSGLWQVQHLDDEIIDESSLPLILSAVQRTKKMECHRW